MKELINRFKKWLIVKLGGYTTVPSSIIKYHTLHPTKVSASFEKYRNYNISEEDIRGYLAIKLAYEIEKSNLFDICQCVDYRHNTIIYEMSILVVDPKECKV